MTLRRGRDGLDPPSTALATALDRPEAALQARSVPGTEAAGRLRERNEGLLVAGVLVYAAIVVVLMVVRGVSISPDVLAVALGLAAVVLGRGRLFLRDWVPFIALLLAYELMRGLASTTGLTVHVADIVALERTVSLGYLPTQVLQDWLHPAAGLDLIAVGATVVYMLHFVLPILTGFILWMWRRPIYFDFVAALIVLCLGGFVTFVLFPVAPPWYAAMSGAINGPDGKPLIVYLKPGAFDQVARALGFGGNYLYSYVFYDVNPNNTAAFPSLHAGFPFLSFLMLRRAFGRIGWVAFAYFLVVSFSVVYLGDHYVVDVLAGVLYAAAAYLAVVRGPALARSAVARMRKVAPAWSLAAPAAAPAPGFGAMSTSAGAPTLAEAGDGAPRSTASRIAWRRLAAGGLMAVVGGCCVAVMQSAHENTTALYLLPWAVLIAGLIIAATGLGKD